MMSLLVVKMKLCGLEIIATNRKVMKDPYIDDKVLSSQGKEKDPNKIDSQSADITDDKVLSCLKVAFLDILQRFGFIKPNYSNKLMKIIDSADEGSLLGILEKVYPTIRSWSDVLTDQDNLLEGFFANLRCPLSQGLCSPCKLGW